MTVLVWVLAELLFHLSVLTDYFPKPGNITNQELEVTIAFGDGDDDPPCRQVSRKTSVLNRALNCPHPALAKLNRSLLKQSEEELFTQMHLMLDVVPVPKHDVFAGPPMIPQSTRGYDISTWLYVESEASAPSSLNVKSTFYQVR